MATPSNKAVFTVRFTSKQLKVLQQVAEEREVSVAEIIRMCVDKVLLPIGAATEANELNQRAN